jgi:hypothetical protein
MLANLKGYQFVGIYFGVFQKVETHILGTLGKLVSKSCKRNFCVVVG